MNVPSDDELIERELQRLGREHATAVQQRRMAHLVERLRVCGSLAVRHSTPGFCGDRPSIHLDDGTVLRMRLFWPRREPLAALCSIRWASSVGWIVVARSTAGVELTLYAWRAAIDRTVAPPGASGERVAA